MLASTHPVAAFFIEKEVKEYQLKYGMQPRNDSRLTTLYKSGMLTLLSPDQVARELVATDYIFSNTAYRTDLEQFLRNVAQMLHSSYRLSWKHVWETVRFYGPIAFKIICLRNAQLRLPNL